MLKNSSMFPLLIVVFAVIYIVIDQVECGWSDKSIKHKEKIKAKSLLGIWSRVGKRESNSEVNPNKFWLRFGKRSADFSIGNKAADFGFGKKNDAVYDMDNGEYFLF